MEWRDSEFLAQREHQAGADLSSASDITSQGGKVADMAATPPGEPPVDYDVRSVYDSRPVNARDFNFSLSQLGTVSGSGAIVFPEFDFVSAIGWRFVVLEWDIIFSPSLGTIGGSVYQNTVVNLLGGGGVADPFNSNIVIGPNGTGEEPIKTFMLVEENTRFGLTLVNTDTTLTIAATAEAIVTVHGNALPVTDVQLPYQIANPVGRGKVGMFAPPMFPFAPPMPAAPGAAPAPAAPAAPAPQSARVAMPRPRWQGGYTALMPGAPVRRGGGFTAVIGAPGAPRRIIRPGSI